MAYMLSDKKHNTGMLTPQGEAFLEDLELICQKHGLSVSHESYDEGNAVKRFNSEHGGFVIVAVQNL